MATVLLKGTQLEPSQTLAPLNQRFLFFVGITFLISMHFFMPNPGGSGIQLSFNPTVWTTITIAIGIGLYQMTRTQSVRYSKLSLGLLIACIIMTVPLFYSGTTDGSTGRILGLWSGWLLFFTLQQFKFGNLDKHRLLWFILVAVIIESIFGYIQYLLLAPGNPFGYNTIANRPYGIFQQPNVMASFLATGLALSGYLLARQPQKKYDRKLRSILFLYSTPILTIPLLIVLASRTGWISAAIVVAMILPYIVRFSTKRRLSFWSLAIVLGLLFGSLMTAQSEQKDFVANKADLESARSFTFPQALDMFVEKPLTGYGYGQFESQYMLYTARQHQLNENYPAGLAAMDHPHNEVLFWGVEGGIIPLLGILLAAAFVMHRIYIARNGTRIALLALLMPIFIHSQLEYPFYHSAIHWITFVILIYWVDQRTAKYKTARFTRVTHTFLRVSSLLLPLLTAAFMLTSLHSNLVLTQFEKSKPKDPEILNRVTNPIAWSDRLDWNIQSTLLNVGLATSNNEYIESYVNWQLEFMKSKPRPAFYQNLMLAYHALGDTQKFEQTLKEAEFLFPNRNTEELIENAISKAAASKVSASESGVSKADKIEETQSGAI